MQKTTWEAIEELPDTQQEALLNRFGYQVTGSRHVDCPVCGKVNKKGDGFRLNWTQKLGGQGQYAGICAGCGPHGIYKLLTSAGATIHELNDLIGFKYGQDGAAKKVEKSPKIRRAEKIFSRGIKIRDSEHATKYFSSRGIYSVPGGHCRFVPMLEYRDKDGNVIAQYDAIISIATDALGKPCYYHATYIENGEKANVDNPRKQFSLMPSNITPKCSIKFSPPGDVTGVGEGIESCLSYGQIYKIPVESCLNTSILSSYRPPEYVRQLHIAVDNDKKLGGQAHAWMLAHRVMTRCQWVNKIILRIPKEAGKDFNNVLLEGIGVDEYVISR